MEGAELIQIEDELLQFEFDLLSEDELQRSSLYYMCLLDGRNSDEEKVLLNRSKEEFDKIFQ